MNLTLLIARCGEEMRRRNLTQKDLAQLAGISESTASRVLNGLGENTTVASLQAVCDALGISTDEQGTVKEPVKEPADESAVAAVYRDRIADLKAQLRQRDRWIRAISIAFLTLVLLIIFLFLYDVLNPNVGWFRRLAQSALSIFRPAI